MSTTHNLDPTAPLFLAVSSFFLDLLFPIKSEFLVFFVNSCGSTELVVRFGVTVLGGGAVVWVAGGSSCVAVVLDEALQFLAVFRLFSWFATGDQVLGGEGLGGRRYTRCCWFWYVSGFTSLGLCFGVGPYLVVSSCLLCCCCVLGLCSDKGLGSRLFKVSLSPLVVHLVCFVCVWFAVF